jgi:hypothetical protein
MPLSVRPNGPVIVLLGIAAVALAFVAVFAGAATRSAAEEGQYLHFTGPDSGYIEVPDAPALDPTAEITIEAWVFIVSGNGWGVDAASEGCPTFVGKNYETAYWFGLDCNGSTNLQFYSQGSGSSVISTASISTGQWVHVAVTYDSASVRFYINGVLDSTIAVGGPLTTNTDPLQIGHDVSWDASPIGHIDEVHIWNIARSGTEIAADMDTIATPQIGLVGVWNMEGSPNANVGGFTGALVADAEFAGTPITASPTPEPPYLKGDTTCDHTTTIADALPYLNYISGISGWIHPCVNPISDTSVQGFSQWWDASPGTGYIEVPDDDAINPTDAITIELRINLYSYFSPDGNTCPSLVGKGYQTAYWVGICSGHLRFYPRGTGSSKDATGLVPLRQWTHIAVVADDTSVKFYINGQLDSEFTNDSAPLTTNDDNLRIGSDPDWSPEPWAAVQEVRIWNIARSQADIEDTMNDFLTTPQTGLVALYHLESDANDATGNHNGAAVGTVSFGNTLPPIYWPDINCDGFLNVPDLLSIIAGVAAVPDPDPLPNGCEAIGTPTG